MYMMFMVLILSAPDIISYTIYSNVSKLLPLHAPVNIDRVNLVEMCRIDMKNPAEYRRSDDSY